MHQMCPNLTHQILNSLDILTNIQHPSIVNPINRFFFLTNKRGSWNFQWISKHSFSPWFHEPKSKNTRRFGNFCQKMRDQWKAVWDFDMKQVCTWVNPTISNMARCNRDQKLMVSMFELTCLVSWNIRIVRIIDFQPSSAGGTLLLQGRINYKLPLRTTFVKWDFWFKQLQCRHSCQLHS